MLKPKDKKFPVVLNSFAGIVDPYRFIYGPARPVNKPVDPDYNNFGPRVGFAYNPDGRAKNVIRGGAGVMFAPRNNSVFAQGPGQPGLPNIYVFSGAELVAAGAKYPYYNDDGYNLIQAQKIFSLGMIWNPIVAGEGTPGGAGPNPGYQIIGRGESAKTAAGARRTGPTCSSTPPSGGSGRAAGRRPW